MKLKPFEKVMERYKAIFLDSYGVIKNFNGIIPGVLESIETMKSHGKEIIVLTNDSSKSPFLIAENFKSYGLKGIHEDSVISSGMMTMYFLKNKIKKGKIAYLGAEDSTYYIKEAGLDPISISEIDLDHIEDITALVFLDDEGFEWQHHLNKVVNLLRMKSIPVVVANSDITYPISKNEVSIATGSLAMMVEKISKKKFIYFGKPDSQMFMLAFEKILESKNLKRNEILMVGDTLNTDIIGGNKFGLSTALVLSGNTSEDQMRTYIKSTGIIPNYICQSIALDNLRS